MTLHQIDAPRKITDERKEKLSKKGDELASGRHQTGQGSLSDEARALVEDKMAGCHGNKGVIVRTARRRHALYAGRHLLVGDHAHPQRACAEQAGQVLETHLGWASLRTGAAAHAPL